MAMTQEPKQIGGTYHIFLAYVSGLYFREYPHLYFRAWKMVQIFSILGSEKFPIDNGIVKMVYQ